MFELCQEIRAFKNFSKQLYGIAVENYQAGNEGDT